MKKKYVRIPSSLKDAIVEDPDRFAKYLDAKRLRDALEPYAAFKEELQRVFGDTTSGLNMWQYLKKSYTLQNRLWKSKTIQNLLPKELRVPLKRVDYQSHIGDFEKKPEQKPVPIVGGAAKSKAVKGYDRFGKKVNGYSRTPSRKFDGDEVDFLRRRKGEPVRETFKAFNRVFRPRTFSSVKTKLVRL